MAQIADVIDSYLASSVDALEAARQLTASIEADLTEPPDDYSASPIFDEILYRIRLVTHDHAWQDKLLNPLGLTVRELWNGSLEKNTKGTWASLNTFVARLTMAEIMDFDSYGVWAMRYALEDDTLAPKPEEVMGKVNEGELNPEVLDSHVPAAAVWVIYAGRHIWALAPKGKEGSKATRGGLRWKGFPGYCVERWNLWKERFQSFAGRTDLNAQTREMSKMAHVIMTKLDGGTVQR
ncbi:uncharacterized protein EV420DRAFT_1633530 [Desarmillaria tabescens]|uniref:Uncharacterized protein n=1 Tax=Armillaria tabescens TaxID=1929756 RepID=A0AA39NNW3_ARMTA|nr:uncharacterized protein EV420DRAFT_1633530 [Desarmillaria tabescens]KAK0469098.1 hypothetical protein EV420DRAFT_1633530 [Desarmillaria tabescens]